MLAILPVPFRHRESERDSVVQRSLTHSAPPCVVQMPSLELVASASMDHTIRLWDMTTGKARRTLLGHTKVRHHPPHCCDFMYPAHTAAYMPLQGVRSLAYSSEYRFLISAGFDYDAMVWNPYVES